MSLVSLQVSKDFTQAFQSGHRITNEQMKVLAEKFVKEDLDSNGSLWGVDLTHIEESLRFMDSSGYATLGILEKRRHDRIGQHQNLDANIGTFLKCVLDYIYKNDVWQNLTLDSKRLFLPYLGLASSEDIVDVFAKCVFESVVWIDQFYYVSDDRYKDAEEVFTKAIAKKAEQEISPKLKAKFKVDTTILANQAENPLFPVDIFDVFYRHAEGLQSDTLEIRFRYFLYETKPKKLSVEKKKEIADFIMKEIKKIPEFKDLIRFVEVVIETQPNNDRGL